MKTTITGSGYNPENGHVIDPTLEDTVVERPILFNTEMVRAILAGKNNECLWFSPHSLPIDKQRELF